MIRRLRFKLILASMLSLLIVLAAIVGGLNAVNYRGILESADGMLSFLRENGGRMPMERGPFQNPALGPDFASPELPYITRYFSAEIRDGVLIAADTGRIAAVGADSVGSYAMRALDAGKARGFVDGYRFLRYEEGDSLRLLFLDCQRSLENFRTVLLLSCGISLLGYATVFLLLLLLSGRIVKPVSESYEKQRRFITDAGHEIKTPITIIDADTEVLEMETGGSEWIDDIRHQTSRLASLTSDLIYLSRMEEQQKPEMIEVPISDLVMETAGSFQAPARMQSKQFHLDVQPMLSCTGDAKGICQLVSILLDNALKYSPEGGAISLALERQGKTLRLTVENSAEGVSAETLKNMFDRFYRGDPSRSSAVKGYGIGLSIARAIVNAHRGRISAASPDGNTVRISVVLPI